MLIETYECERTYSFISVLPHFSLLEFSLFLLLNIPTANKCRNEKKEVISNANLILSSRSINTARPEGRKKRSKERINIQMEFM